MSTDALARFLSGLTRDTELWEAVCALAAEHGYELGTQPQELSEDELDSISGGATVKTIMTSLTGGGLPDGMSNPTASPVPIPYPNIGTGTGGSVTIDGTGSTDGSVSSSSGDEAGTSKDLVIP